ncbi:RsiV family protein [Pseudomonas sp. SA3-5]|uniref:RsiV family protein n=1 Tax=Pseudomonas aestuarii TaxID=3018340 RepID=A0ABT4X983_9PSED|nr:RsiV family protein [Pseudomonas aestuarii]MDA7084937.1 RsiV family protein [Pseudomonas aestuarii]
MFARKKLVTLSLCLLLSACQSLLPGTDPLPVQRVAWEHIQPDCQGQACPLVNIDTLIFPDEPPLSALIEQRLLQMTNDSPDAPLPASLQSYESDFLHGAKRGWNTYLQAKVREQHDQLVVIELSSYLSTGGAHGMPGRGFINYDRTRQQALSLQDMLVPGQTTAFWNLASQAHQRWLAANQLDQDPEYSRNWPFEHTENVALGQAAMLLKYNVYSIAPYSSGHPQLTIPYSQLQGILKPQYFPAGD